MDQSLPSDVVASLRPEAFPGILADVARIAGAEAALKLAETHGGTYLYIPKSISADHWLAESIGLEAARELVAVYGRDKMRIGSCRPLLHWIRARTLRQRGMTVRQIARELGICVEAVAKLLRGLNSASAQPGDS